MTHPLNILIVEDDPSTASLARKAVEEAGNTTEVCATGQAALARMAGGEVDLVLLESKLPDMTGNEALQRLSRAGRDVPVIMLVDQGDERLAAAAIMAGARDYLVKDDEFQYLQDLPAIISRTHDEFDLENRLTQSEVRYKLIMEGIRMVGWEYEPAQSRFTFVSGQAEEIFGYPRRDWYQENFWAGHIHPDDRERVLGFCASAFEKGEDHQTEYRMIAADGEEVWVKEYAQVIFQNGEPFKMRGVLLDTSERKRAEIALRVSEERFRSAFVHAAIGKIIGGKDGRFLDVNHSFCKMIGYSKEELLSMSFEDITHPDDLHNDDLFVRDMLNGDIDRFQVEKRYKTKGGETVWGLLSVSLVHDAGGAPLYFFDQIQDITERKIAEQALLKTNTLLDSIHQAQNQFIAEADVTRVFENLLNILLSLTGSEYGFLTEYLHEEDGEPYLLVRAITNIAWNDDMRALYEKLAAGGMKFSNFDTLIGAVVTSGEPVIANHPATDPRSGGLPEGHPPLESFLGLPVLKGGTLMGAVGVANRPGGYDEELAGFLEPFLSTCANIYEALRNEQSRRRAEAALRESEERFRQLFEHAPDAMFLADPETCVVVDANEAASKLLDRPRERIIGMKQTQLHPPRLELQMRESYRNHALEKVKGLPVETAVIRTDGHEVAVDIMAHVVRIKGKKFVLGVFRDITERKRIENELRASKEEAERATALKDKFVSLVTHDLRSPFTAILGLLRLLDADKEKTLTARQKEIVGAALQSGDNLLDMIEQLLNISRLQSGAIHLERTSIDANAVADTVMGGLAHLAGQKGVTLRNETPSPFRLYADPTLFHQALSNLVSNAIKFCGKGDQVTVFSPPETPDSITVKDTGVGIPPELMPDLFKHEKKTTTEGTDGEKGTGLGLPYCRDIMEAHGGDITTESEEGKGSVFCLRFPKGNQ